MIALKMIEMMETSYELGKRPTSWRVRDAALVKLRRECRHTGDLRREGDRLAFLGVPVEIADVRNTLGAELVT